MSGSPICTQSTKGEASWQTEFNGLLPEIRQRISQAFRHLNGDAREEVLQEGIVNCVVRFERLARQGRSEVASAASLAKYAVRQIRSGRRIAQRMNTNDPLSRYAQIRKGIRVESLNSTERGDGRWVDVAVAGRAAPIPDQVALRMDVPEWLKRFARRTRRIARDLALGWTTSELARRYRLSPARISQLRRELYQSWTEFQGTACDAV